MTCDVCVTYFRHYFFGIVALYGVSMDSNVLPENSKVHGFKSYKVSIQLNF